jgi:hypothetical protein
MAEDVTRQAVAEVNEEVKRKEKDTTGRWGKGAMLLEQLDLDETMRAYLLARRR